MSANRPLYLRRRRTEIERVPDLGSRRCAAGKRRLRAHGSTPLVKARTAATPGEVWWLEEVPGHPFDEAEVIVP